MYDDSFSFSKEALLIHRLDSLYDLPLKNGSFLLIRSTKSLYTQTAVISKQKTLSNI